MSERVAFLGMGVMGGPMAARLAQAGHELTVWNRTPEKAEAWVAQHGGRQAKTPAEAVRGATFVFTCVGDDAHVRQVATAEDGIFAGISAGALWVDHTTASAEVAREMAQLAALRAAAFLDAPVSGGQQGAQNGRLTIMVGGDAADVARAQPLLAAYALCVRHLGPAGHGQLTKMVNQICIAGVLQGLSEGLHFAQAAGLDPADVVEVIAKGAAQSWQMDHRAATMIGREFAHGFAVDWMRKDLGLALAAARRTGAALPLTALVDQFYAEVQRLGGGRWDTSSLIERLHASAKSGLT